MKELIIASNNENKLKEYRSILKDFNFDIKSQSEAGINIEVEETGTTFEENSKLKADAIFELTHKNVIADDSGLMINALNGEPGVYSARYKGLKNADQRNGYILGRLESESDRTATFVTTIYYIDETGHAELFKGLWNGSIRDRIRGEEGFGYDPIFIPEGETKTTAELGIEYKNANSHRARATKELVKYLKKTTH